MAHVISSLRTHTPVEVSPASARSIAQRQRQVIATQKTAPPPAVSAALSTSATPAGVKSQAPDFRALFTGQTTPAVPEPPAQKPAPTAESVFGAKPWMSNPTGIGPNGQPYSYNPFYFATAETAARVAQMAGGTVVETQQFTPGGGAFSQQQPNYMVKLADGRLINPGLVASFYTHGYSQSYVDQMVAAEFKNA